MKNQLDLLEREQEDSLFLKDNLLKYLSKWPWILISLILSVILSILIIRYAPVIYSTEAKIKIIDDSKEFDIAEDALSLLGGGSKVNLANEIAVIRSYRIMEQVVDSLDLDIEYYEVGSIKTQQIHQSPLVFSKLFSTDSIIKPINYEVSFNSNNIKITDNNGETKELKPGDSMEFLKTKFPVRIKLNDNFNFKQKIGSEYLVKINNKKETVLKLINKVLIYPLSEKSDVLVLNTKNESFKLSETILNSLIEKFNNDGILDNQLVSKRTLDFIDDRFLYLSKELDSIEINKKNYKQSNNLSYIEADAGVTIEKKAITENEVFRLETQIQLSQLLKADLDNTETFNLLPADIGVESTNINSLINSYNTLIIEREKLIISAGINNPTVDFISSQLFKARVNILNTINSYQKQLTTSLKELKKQQNSAGSTFSKLPEKEKMLRSIERQQLIKENLFLLLLQKREEAAINFAVTAPTVKIVDYGLTSLKPVSPKKIVIFGILFFLGLFIPIAILFIKYSFDTKIKSKSDIEKINPNTPFLAEIPFLKDTNIIIDPNERSIKAESFRILSTNINFLLQKDKKEGHTIYITSAIKGEGKTLVAINVAITFANLSKKVLLIGADLRNPQLHNYLNVDKNTKGLSNFLHDSRINWLDCISKDANGIMNLDICFGGPIPPNASQLIAGENMKVFLDLAKENYDYIIVDTAPTIQVADTMLIAEYSDMVVFITRSGYTDKRLVQFSKDLSLNNRLKNMSYVLNAVEHNKVAGYNYGYEYGYDDLNK